jgi:hypothetical protein
MSVDSLAHADSLELLAMFHSDIDMMMEFEMEMEILAQKIEASTPDPTPENR